jgi:aspartate/methionine/tyrosine aminotransferase
MLNSPCNPTGAVYSADDLAAAVAVAKRHNLLIISDECYNGFCYDGPFASPWSLYDRVILLRGFSKTYAMTGWRLGYAVGPAPIIQAMTTLQQYTFVCGPAPLQVGAVAAFQTSPSARIDDFRERRNMIYEGLRERFRVQKPGGAFYIFPEAPGGSGTKFVAKAIEKGVLIIPGGVFSERDTHLRISYAASRDTIRRGIDALNKLAVEMDA